MIPAVTLVGKSGSGKTGVIDKLIAEFKTRGYRVAAVKHSHETVEIDTEGKDTWRFTRAGSDATVISSPTSLALFRNVSEELTVEEVLTALGGDYDIAILEGFKRSRIPKIEVHRSDQGENMVCAPEELVAVITDKELSLDLPRFKSDDIVGIADFIEKEIIAGASPDISVIANGKQVFMKPFVKEIISSAILAMLGSLKDAGIIKNVTIIIRNKM